MLIITRLVMKKITILVKRVKMNNPQRKIQKPTAMLKIKLLKKRTKEEMIGKIIVIKKMNKVRSVRERKKVFRSLQRKKKKLTLSMI